MRENETRMWLITVVFLFTVILFIQLVTIFKTISLEEKQQDFNNLLSGYEIDYADNEEVSE